jgi:hypothetical protein
MKQVLKDTIEDLIVTALEGGSSYWYFLPLENKDSICEAAPGEPLSIQISSFIKAGGTITITDCEDQEEELGKINMKSIENAFELMIANHIQEYANIIQEDYDVDDADIWFQLAVMSKVIFG